MNYPGVCSLAVAQPGFFPHAPALDPEPLSTFPLAEPGQVALCENQQNLNCSVKQGRELGKGKAAATSAGAL